jgi:hypothetical protein
MFSDSFETQCKVVTARCGNEITPEACAGLTSSARVLNYIADDAVAWLTANGYCPVGYDSGDGHGAHLQYVCKQGCFAEDTEILSGFTADGEPLTTAASQIKAADTLMSMADESSLAEVGLVPRPIGAPIHGPEKPPLFAFALANGSTLRVTQHHPMVLASGIIVEARQVKSGASFVGFDGKPVAITSITRERTTGEVYNFETASDTELGHIIVAEGVLVGDLKLQDDLAREEGAIALRR